MRWNQLITYCNVPTPMPSFYRHLLNYLQWGVISIQSERGQLVTLPIIYTSGYIVHATLASDAPNPGGINTAVIYAYKYDNSKVKLQTDVIQNFDIDKPLSAYWTTIGV